MIDQPEETPAEPKIAAATCPRCGAPTLKNWELLNSEERDAAQRLTGSSRTSTGATVTPERFCTRCLYAEFTPTLRDC